jgi:hypothetical protein
MFLGPTSAALLGGFSLTATPALRVGLLLVDVTCIIVGASRVSLKLGFVLYFLRASELLHLLQQTEDSKRATLFDVCGSLQDGGGGSPEIVLLLTYELFSQSALSIH